METRTDPRKLRYVLYARKSSEAEDRQVQSIPDQIDRLERLAMEKGLQITARLEEQKSAKNPDERPEFKKLVGLVKAGKVDGILCWQINRLSRNPVDSGEISWLLQQGKLKSIQTYEREYLPEDNVLLFSVESGMANQYIIELRKNVKRGTDSKLAKGWAPNRPPLGYLNDKSEKTIVRDPERFVIIRKMWDLMLTGTYTVPKVLDKATKEWGLRTRKSKKLGGRILSASGAYKIFGSVFYTGLIPYMGKLYEGKHEPMVTMAEFERVQAMLHKPEKQNEEVYEFPYTGMVRCGECGCMVTAEVQVKRSKTKPGQFKNHVYYHCTLRSKYQKCGQRKYVRGADLDAQISDLLSKVTILPEFRDWAVESLSQANAREIEERTAIFESQHRALAQAQRSLDNLTQMRYKDMIGDEEFLVEKNKLQEQIVILKTKMKETDSRTTDWLELTEKVFHFASNARLAFLQGDVQTKREILTALGSNLILKDRKLSLTTSCWLVPIEVHYPPLEEAYRAFEPSQVIGKSKRTDAKASVLFEWLGDRDSNPDTMVQSHVSCRWTIPHWFISTTQL